MESGSEADTEREAEKKDGVRDKEKENESRQRGRLRATRGGDRSRKGRAVKRKRAGSEAHNTYNHLSASLILSLDFTYQGISIKTLYSSVRGWVSR